MGRTLNQKIEGLARETNVIRHIIAMSSECSATEELGFGDSIVIGLHFQIYHIGAATHFGCTTEL